jgi:hypothetical protein
LTLIFTIDDMLFMGIVAVVGLVVAIVYEIRQSDYDRFDKR